jgi:hypothetical protein
MRGVVLGYLMKNRPSCCAPLKYNGAKGRIENLVPGFKGPRCEGIARSTGKKCQDVAVTGSNKCRKHGGKLILRAKLKDLNPKLCLVISPTNARRRYEGALRALPGNSHENSVD